MELGKEIKTVLSTGAQDLSLTCKGRTLPPSPPAISMFSICERVVSKCEAKASVFQMGLLTAPRRKSVSP